MHQVYSVLPAVLIYPVIPANPDSTFQEVLHPVFPSELQITPYHTAPFLTFYRCNHLSPANLGHQTDRCILSIHWVF